MTNNPLNLLFKLKSIKCRTGILLFTLLPLGCPSIKTQIDVDKNIFKKATKGKPEYLHELIKNELKEGDRNRVLNWNRIGLRSFRNGDLNLSARYFDLSITKINEIFRNDARSQMARSIWFSEESKSYKGHPYERAMTFFFRGLNYYLRGDLENARAMFKSGQLQDAFAEEGQHKSDYALFDYLEGRITQKLESRENAKPLFNRMKKMRPKISAPKKADNLLIIAATNSGPSKFSNPNHPDPNERIKIRIAKGQEKITNIMVFHENKLLGTFFKIEDLNFQASTRGGRIFDAIVKGKAEFKDNTDKAGDTALVTGSTIIHASDGFQNENTRAKVAIIGLGVMAAGGVLKAVSSLIDARVDTRTWKSLPGQFHIWSHKIYAKKFPVQIRYYSKGVKYDPSIIRLIKQKKTSAPQFHESLEKYEETQHRKELSIKIFPKKKDTLIYLPSPNIYR